MPSQADRSQASDTVSELARSGVSPARQDVVTLARATVGNISRSRRYRNLLSSYGLAHELVAILRSGDTCWASVTLNCERGTEDFSDDDLAFIAVTDAR
jgi:hypothetical protein